MTPTPGASHIYLSKALPPVVGAAHALAVDGHDLAGGQFKGILHPVPKALLETGRIQPREDPSQGIVRGDPVRQLQEGAQPLLVEPAEEGAIAMKLSAPQMTASTDSTRMSVRGCSFVRSTRGSSKASMVSTRDGGGLDMRRSPQAGFRNRPL